MFEHLHGQGGGGWLKAQGFFLHICDPFCPFLQHLQVHLGGPVVILRFYFSAEQVVIGKELQLGA